MTVILRHPLTATLQHRTAASTTIHRFSAPAEIIAWSAYTSPGGARQRDDRWSPATCIAFVAAAGIAGWIVIAGLIALVA